ncbi:MAG: hydrolase [Erythrobacter sp. RIFCSPHIGHO2_12_FULL_63_10]|nr:MAG: hydrolase [Erythrobacter sp. RIFCSPHIGHO2_12_FULL_63_10]
MRFKAHKYGAVALAVTLSLTFASADLFSAFAQSLSPDETTIDTATQPLPDGDAPVAPIFISREVVQAIPATERDSRHGAADTLADLVERTEVDSSLSEQMQCLAGAVYFESRGEPLAGQLAVAQVVINRAGSGSFPQSYCGVVHQRGQFSFVSNGAMPRISTETLAWQRAKAIARIAHEGLWESEAGDSLYFHANYVHPSWSNRKIARATISRHVFYR